MPGPIRLGKQAVLVGLVALAVLFATANPGGSEASQLMATAPSLGSAASFAVLGGSTVTNTGPTTISGSLGVWPGLAITGFPPGSVSGGATHAGDAVAQGAQSSVTTAYNALDSQACTADLTGQDLGGKTLLPGVYCFSSSAQLTGDLTLNAQGNGSAVFIFKIGSTLTTASNARVLLINAGSGCNVFWKVGSSATIGTNTSFVGNILALTSITLNTTARVTGRALARNGAVTMDNNVVSGAACGAGAGTATATTVPSATKTAVAGVTKTAVAGATKTAVVRATNTAVARATKTAVAVLGVEATRTPAVSALPNAGEPGTPSYGWIVLAAMTALTGGVLFIRRPGPGR